MHAPHILPPLTTLVERNYREKSARSTYNIYVYSSFQLSFTKYLSHIPQLRSSLINLNTMEFWQKNVGKKKKMVEKSWVMNVNCFDKVFFKVKKDLWWLLPCICLITWYFVGKKSKGNRTITTFYGSSFYNVRICSFIRDSKLNLPGFRFLGWTNKNISKTSFRNLALDFI